MHEPRAAPGFCHRRRAPLSACHNSFVQAKALDGILVIDLTRYLPGPMAAKMLANLGARVIKVEEPEFGDPVRESPPKVRGASALARLLLTGVESVALDLKREPAREMLLDLLDRADVLLESYRPGKLAAFGLTDGVLEKRYPQLVVCSISGWGQSGPDRDRVGHDLTYQAAAGALAGTAEMPNLPAADMLGAFSAVSAVTASLLGRERTGRGVRIDASLFDAAVIGNLTGAAGAETGAGKGGEAGEPGGLTGAFPCYRLYDTLDARRFALAALEPRFWKRLCAAVERPDLLPDQYRRSAEAHRRLEELFRSRPSEAWSELCRKLDLPGEIVLGVAEAANSRQARARKLSVLGGRLPFPALFDDARPEAEGSFPALGQSTRSVIAEFRSDVANESKRVLRRAGIGRRWTLRQAVRHWVAGRLAR